MLEKLLFMALGVIVCVVARFLHAVHRDAVIELALRDILGHDDDQEEP